MSEDATEHAEIYLFEIVQPKNDFAKFGKVYKRRNATRPQALEDVRKGPPYSGWRKATGHMAGGLDMKFSRNTKALVIIRIPFESNGVVETTFGEKMAVDLDVKRKPNMICIKNCDRHDFGTGEHKVCSFEIDMPRLLQEQEGASLHHPISRFPIMFDFIDSDGVSPVFKGTHNRAALATNGVGHGGIHPRGGSSMIVIE